MKKIFKPFALAVAVLAAFTACNKEAEVISPDENGECIVLSFVSEKPELIDGDTRTVYNSSTGSIEWSTGDKISVGITVDDEWMAASAAPEQGESAKLFTSTGLSEGGSTGVFSVPTSFTVALPGTYKFYGLYPETLVSSNNASHIPSVSITIPATQITQAGSFDKSADVMVAVSEEYDGIPSDRKVDLMWNRVVAHGDITLKNLPSFASDETLQGLSISAQEGADLVGYHFIDLTTGEVTLPSGTAAVNTIQIDTRNLTIDTAQNTLEFWFSSLPFTATSIKVVLTTNKKVYTKEYTGINLLFLANRRNKLGIGMKNAAVVDKTQLVANGDYVISYDSANKMMAVGNPADAFRGSVDLDMDTPTDDAIWTITYDAQNDAYRIYNADEAKYLYGWLSSSADDSSTYLELHEDNYASDHYTCLFQISESSTTQGAFEITPLGNNFRKVGFNTQQPRFALYKGTAGSTQHVDLNLHSVSFDTTPRIEVVTSSVNLAKNAITEARTISTIKRKYFDGPISAESSASWLVVYDLAEGETEVKATVAANTGAQRTATITLSANGIESKTIEVTQAVGSSTVTDVINRALTGVTETSYTNWSGKTSNSAAVYAGKTAGGYDAVQMTNSTNTAAGIVTTASGGALKKIVVTWNSNTSSDRSLEIYGKSSAYESPADLFDNTKAGTKIGTIARSATTLEVEGDYEYFGIKAIKGAVYLDLIEITWGDAKQVPEISWSASTATATLSNSGLQFEAPTLSYPEGLSITYVSTTPTVASVSDAGVVTPLAAGTTEIKAIFDGDDNYKPKTVSYALTVVDNRTFSITVNQPEEGGSISVNPSGPQKAGTVITLSANPATGYVLANWIVTSATGSVDVTDNQFTMPASNVTVSASFIQSSSQPKTSTLTFTAACGGSGTADDGVKWTVTSDGTESSFDNTKGIHYGTGSAAVQYIRLTTSDISGTITKVVVNASTASGVTASVDVKVGGSAFGGDPQSLTTSAANYTFEGSATGEIIVNVSKPSSATKAIYVKSVAVTYTPQQ